MALDSLDLLARTRVASGIFFTTSNVTGAVFSGFIVSNDNGFNVIVTLYQNNAANPIKTVTVTPRSSVAIPLPLAPQYGVAFGAATSPTAYVSIETHGVVNAEDTPGGNLQSGVTSFQAGLPTEPQLGLMRKHSAVLVNAAKNVGTVVVDMSLQVLGGASAVYLFGNVTTAAGNAATFQIQDTAGNLYITAPLAGYAGVVNNSGFSGWVPLTFGRFQYVIGTNNTTLTFIQMGFYML